MVHEDVLPALEEELSAMWRRGRVAMRDAARALHPGLDPTAFPLVAVLGREGAMRISELGAELSLDKSTISRQLDAAVRVGLVERTVDPSDARARLVDLTAEGRARLAVLRAEQRTQWKAALERWSRADIVALTGLLAQLRESGV